MGTESREVEAHGWGSNTNDDALEDDEIEAHGWTGNTNEDALEDDEADELERREESRRGGRLGEASQST